jgi:probable F420-dependent oxidoreductase
MLLANLGYDLQLQSRGRFILGLGSQIRPHIEKRYSAVWSHPAARMREMVLAIRAIWRAWHEGAKLDFRGDFYTHTLMTPVFDPGPHPHGLPPIFVAGIGPRMTEVAGEVADGFFVHPFHTPEFIERVTLPALERGFAKSGRARDRFAISCQAIIASGTTEAEFENAKNVARAQLSFYGSTPAYRSVLDCHGWGDLHEELNRLSKQGGWLEMAGLIDDEVLEAIAVVGAPREVGAKLRARCAKFADRVSLVAPFEPDPWTGDTTSACWPGIPTGSAAPCAPWASSRSTTSRETSPTQRRSRGRSRAATRSSTRPPSSPSTGAATTR